MKNLPKKILLVSLFIITLSSVVYFFVIERKLESTTSQPTNQNLTGTDVIAIVGEEKIYQQYLDKELVAYPPTADARDIVMKKLIEDSVVLQEGVKDGLISKQEKSTTDYSERIKLVKKVRQVKDNSVAKVKGQVVSLWFMNMEPAQLGYEEGKIAAYSKIKPLYDKVVDGTLTAKQASEEIINDSSMALIDRSYKTNALLEFNTNQELPLTFDANFDLIIKQLKQGEVSELYLAKDKLPYTDEVRDAVYMFAVVYEKDLPGNVISDWLDKAKQNYEVKYY